MADLRSSSTPSAEREMTAERGGPGPYLARLQDLCMRRGNAANAARVASLAERLATQTFNLVVFGEFKRGKTTFVNALLGDALLPSAVVPLTSIVTILHHAMRETIEVEFLDGTTQTIEREQLPDYITERGNPGNVRGVRVVRAGVPSELLRNGMQLVDTPGVGSVYDHNTKATMDFLPQVDGAILLVASDPPISRGECEFLREMKPHVARLFVVQNKVDQLRPDDLEECLAFTSDVLRDVLGNGPVRVFPVSAREALEGRISGDRERECRSGLQAFEEELRRFQEDEQTRALTRSVVAGALRVAEDERLSLSLERQTLRMSVEEIEARYRSFLQRRDEILAQREDDLTLARAATSKLIDRTLLEDYENETKRRAPELSSRLSAWFDRHEGKPPREILAQVPEFIRSTLFEVLGEWRETEERRVEEALSRSLERFTTRANEVLAAIYESAREAFNIPPSTVETVGHLTTRSRFIWREWDWGLHISPAGSLVMCALPGARRRLFRASLDVLLEEHGKACGRLRYDFAQRARAEADQYMRSLERALNEAMDGIDRVIAGAIALKRRVTEDSSQQERRVARETEELDQIVNALRAAASGGHVDGGASAAVPADAVPERADMEGR